MTDHTRTQGEHDHFVRHGGVHFRSHVSPQQINTFIGRLPAGKRESLFEVLDQLEKAGMITIYNDHLFTDGNGVVGGGEQTAGEGEAARPTLQ
ncbi:MULTISPECIES: hypothetical protein [Brevibacillus]|uniref:Uncharacterized protein n=1 Tax=Brevibacillus borstelensis AK1 TaxID=1300222 RepID=M8DG07_9BACL|nr:hypothetical protein [Brevibacillus borstelensis]EMT52382.1 hypothetical protein I532_12034 [Brevibacillus borstelensis AK1]KKX54820.1 hypothetical protein X546_13480 [Brevibacillus borstelensis cifa_chp40]MBE5396168.1 hypothetical protein [Brevibacillus borstelensis]MCC0563074.1 hypothetical protein [Brevibacillus borstelensis]MCM3469016.1 hypothetical protein [Brevibacillus borstelensis]